MLFNKNVGLIFILKFMISICYDNIVLTEGLKRTANSETRQCRYKKFATKKRRNSLVRLSIPLNLQVKTKMAASKSW